MRLFYNPDIKRPLHTLTEEESKHGVRVLRLTEGDEIHLTDGRGMLYTARIAKSDPKKCQVEITDTQAEYGRRSYGLVMAVAPNNNSDRYVRFLEKATEVGCDAFNPVERAQRERRVVKAGDTGT